MYQQSDSQSLYEKDRHESADHDTPEFQYGSYRNGSHVVTPANPLPPSKPEKKEFPGKQDISNKI